MSTKPLWMSDTAWELTQQLAERCLGIFGKPGKLVPGYNESRNIYTWTITSNMGTITLWLPAGEEYEDALNQLMYQIYRAIRNKPMPYKGDSVKMILKF